MTAAANIKAALRRAYCAPEYAILFEVLDATGARHTRSADAVAMSLWPSRGLSVTGFEIKVFRGDWLREKTNPQKAEAIAKYCDFWFLVTPPGLLKVEELPETWGLKEVGEGGAIRTVKEAGRLDPKPLDRLFVASLLRNANKVETAEVEAAIQARLPKLVEAEVQRREHWRTTSKDRYRKLDEMLRRLNDDGCWVDDEQVLDAIAAVLKTGVLRSYGGLLSLHADLTKMAEHIGTAMGVLNMPTKKRGRA